MLVMGLLLVLVAIALTVGAVYDGAEPATVELLGTELDTTVAGVFFTGAGTTLLLFLGLALMKSATARSRKRRAERKEVKTRHRDSVSRLEQERNDLRAENERLARDSAGTAAAGPSAAGTSTAGRVPEGNPTDEPTPSGRHAEAPVAAGEHVPPATAIENERLAGEHQRRT